MSKQQNTSTKKYENTSHNSVGGNQQCEEKTLKGYAMPLHAYLRKKYGPMCGFDPMANVFNMLEQHILGNHSIEDGMQLGRSFMAKQTGLTVYQVDKALKELAKRKMIHIQQVCRIKIDGKKVWEESIYRLHPEKYGVDILRIDESKPPEPKLLYIPGGKLVHKNVVSMLDRGQGGSMKNQQNADDPSLRNRPIVNDPSLNNQGNLNDPSLKNPGILNDQNTGNEPPEPIVTTDKSLKESIRFLKKEGSLTPQGSVDEGWKSLPEALRAEYPNVFKKRKTS